MQEVIRDDATEGDSGGCDGPDGALRCHRGWTVTCRQLPSRGRTTTPTTQSQTVIHSLTFTDVRHLAAVAVRSS